MKYIWRAIRRWEFPLEWITTDNVPQEIWRRLLEYTNADLAIDAISALHGAPTAATLQNYKKQAAQIRVVLLEAREYFDAAETSTLYTSPTQIYYGAIALATAIMLTRGDGDKSLDRLRQAPGNDRHGLRFTTSANAVNCSKGALLLEKSLIEVEDRGHFQNWYSTLPNRMNLEALEIRTDAGGGALRRLVLAGSENTLPVADLIGRKDSLFDLIRFIPDLHFELSRAGLAPDSSRVSFEIYNSSTNPDTVFSWKIHHAKDATSFLSILDLFQMPAHYWSNADILESDTGRAGQVRITNLATDRFHFRFPSSREAADGTAIIYAKYLEIPEIADLYRIAYGLSMLSRYYPDLWVQFLESRCRGAQLIEWLQNVQMRKLPLLTLSALMGQAIVVSTQRPYWYSVS
jgi:hypothetical protein